MAVYPHQRNTSLWSFIATYHTPGAPLVVGSLEYFTANIDNWAVKKHEDPVKSTFLRTDILFYTIFDITNQTLRLSGKVLEGGPCTPFDPAPLGLALHEAQGEELVSTPVFITAGLKRTIRTKYKQ